MSSHQPLSRTADAKSQRQAPATRAWTYAVVLALALGLFMAMLDATVVNVALGSIQDEFSASLTALVWTIDAYTLTFAALLLLGGSLADALGAKSAYVLGLIWFVSASALCAIANSATMLIMARLLQGIGAALFMPSSLSLLTESFPDRATRTKVVGVWAALVGIAVGSGPFIGGLLVAHYGWRSVFYLNLPVGLLGSILTLILLPGSTRRVRPFDVLSHGFIMASLGGLSYVLIEGPVLGWFYSPQISGAAVGGLVAFGGFLFRELTSQHPVVPSSLAESAPFWALNAMGFLSNFVIFGEIFVVSLFLQHALGASALATGVDMLPIMCVISVMNVSFGYLAHRWGDRRIMILGLLIALLGTAGATLLGGGTSYEVLIGPIALCNAGMGLALPAITTGVMHEVGPADANVGAATLNAVRQIGGLAGVAVIGIVLHLVGDWTNDIRLSFGIFAACHVAGLLLARWGLRRGDLA